MRMMINSSLLGVALTIIGIFSYCNAAEIETYEEDWTKANGTVILSYRHGLFDEDKLANAICETDARDEYIKVCKLHIELPRFSGNKKNCTTILQSSSNEQVPLLPRRLSSVNSSIIFSWLDTKIDHDVLVVRLIDMTNCKARDLTRTVAKNSTSLVIPFSDSFDLFYRSNSRHVEEHKRYMKQTFTQNGDEVGDPVPFFERLSKDDIGPVKSMYKPLSRIFPAFTKDRSLGYFFISASPGAKQTKIKSLDPNGQDKGSYRLEFDILPDLNSHGQGSIMFRAVVGNGTHRYVVLDNNLNVLGDFNEESGNGRVGVDDFLVDFDQILAVTCDDFQKKSKDLACYVEILTINTGLRRTFSIPYILDKHFPYIVPSYANGRICINVFTHETTFPGRQKTICIVNEIL